MVTLIIHPKHLNPNGCGSVSANLVDSSGTITVIMLYLSHASSLSYFLPSFLTYFLSFFLFLKASLLERQMHYEERVNLQEKYDQALKKVCVCVCVCVCLAGMLLCFLEYQFKPLFDFLADHLEFSWPEVKKIAANSY